MRRKIYDVLWFILIISLFFLSLMVFALDIANAEELPEPSRPEGTIHEIGNEKLLCYDKENARRIAIFVAELVPYQKAIIENCHQDVAALEHIQKLQTAQIELLVADLENKKKKISKLNLKCNILLAAAGIVGALSAGALIVSKYSN